MIKKRRIYLLNFEESSTKEALNEITSKIRYIFINDDLLKGVDK